MTETKNLKLKTYETATDGQELVASYIDNTSDNFKRIDEFCTTDKTLSVEGGIADAKITGDNISQLKEDIAALMSSTKNLIQNDNPEYTSTNTAQLLADFGHDVTFENGVCISFDCENVNIVGATAGLFYVEKADGTKTYVTFNQCRLMREGVAVPNHSGAITDRVFSNATALVSSVTFQKLCMYNASSRYTGTLSNLMLTNGSYPSEYTPAKTANVIQAKSQDEKSILNATVLDYDAIRWSKDRNFSSNEPHFEYAASEHHISERIDCTPGDKIIYTLSNALMCPMLIVFNQNGQPNHITLGEGATSYVSGEYVFGDSDAYFKIACMYNYSGHYSIKYVRYDADDAKNIHDVERMVNENEARITLIDSGIVPAYWKPALAEAVKKINELQADEDTASFAFISDTHWGDNAKNSPALLYAICQSCNIPVILHGGDVTTGAAGESESMVVNTLMEETSAFRPLHERLLRAEGNHDANYSDSANYDSTVNIGRFYNAFFRWQNGNVKIHPSSNGRYAYMDDTLGRVRYISLNHHDLEPSEASLHKWTHYSYSNAQLDWLANTALKGLDDGWVVVIMTHEKAWGGAGYRWLASIVKSFNNKKSSAIYPYGEGQATINANVSGSWEDGTTWERSVTYDHTNDKGSIIFTIHGHDHVDSIETIEPYSRIPECATANDSMNVTSGAPTKVRGTDTEQLFDVLTINKRTRKVNITRIGAGTDRWFTY